MTPLRTGLFSIGNAAYWPQFSDLRERLLGYNCQIASVIGRQNIELVNLGLVDSPEKGFDAGDHLRQAGVELLFLHSTTCAPSSAVLPAVQIC